MGMAMMYLCNTKRIQIATIALGRANNVKQAIIEIIYFHLLMPIFWKNLLRTCCDDVNVPTLVAFLEIGLGLRPCPKTRVGVIVLYAIVWQLI